MLNALETAVRVVSWPMLVRRVKTSSSAVDVEKQKTTTLRFMISTSASFPLPALGTDWQNVALEMRLEEDSFRRYGNVMKRREKN